MPDSPLDEQFGPTTRREEDALRDLFAADSAVPQRIGPYRIIDLIGTGGMGRVYRAELQEGTLVLRLAVKVIKPGHLSEEARRRFDFEARAMAALDHEAIAKVHGTGATQLGDPYIAMELVEGIELTRYCDAHNMSLGERIRLFQRVCAGVDHAHRRLVIHRDLKPANILVVEREGTPQPKIIDFGIARALEREAFDGALVTLGRAGGTPEYMAPEQASDHPERVDTSADVYSLGAVLYELLCGQLPFESSRLRDRRWTDVEHMLREQTPPSLSSRFASGDDTASSRAGSRGTTAEAMRRALRNDLDWIVAKAMAKEPGRRYASPADLAADLERYLSGMPVLAGPPSTVYRLGKFFRRHRTPAVLLATLVSVTAIAAFMFANEAQAAEGMRRNRAEDIWSQVLKANGLVKALDADGRWPLASLAKGLKEVDEATDRFLKLPLEAEAAPRIEECRRIKEESRLLGMDVRLMEAGDASVDGLVMESRPSHDRALLRRTLEALHDYGVDLTSNGGAAWLTETAAVVRSSRRPAVRRLLLRMVNMAHNLSAVGSDHCVGTRAAELMRECFEEPRRSFLLDGMPTTRAALAKFLERLPEVTAKMEDPLELLTVFSQLYAKPETRTSAEIPAARIEQIWHVDPRVYEGLLAYLLVEWKRSYRSDPGAPCFDKAAAERLEFLSEVLIAGMPERRAGWLYRARLAALLGQSEPPAFASALSFIKVDPHYLYFTGAILQAHGKLSEARSAYERALAVAPTHVAARMGLVGLVKGVEKRVDILEAGLKLDPWSADFACPLCDGHAQAGRWQDFLRVAAPLLELKWDERDPLIMRMLARGARRRGDLELTRLCLRAALLREETEPERTAIIGDLAGIHCPPCDLESTLDDLLTMLDHDDKVGAIESLTNSLRLLDREKVDDAWRNLRIYVGLEVWLHTPRLREVLYRTTSNGPSGAPGEGSRLFKSVHERARANLKLLDH